MLSKAAEKLYSLENKVAVVTGGGRGLGKAFCKGLAEFGAKVAVLDINEESCQAVADEIRADGGEAAGFRLDVSNTADIEKCMKAVACHFGGINVLVNNAGVVSRAPALELEEADWDRVMDINVKGTYFCAREAAKCMIPQYGGKIINIASISSYRGIANRSVYCISKGAILQVTRVLAIEWAPYNIHVNAIAPSYLDTPLTQPLYAQDKEFYAYIMRKTPFKRIAKPEELIGGLIYLASDSSDMVTGEIMAIDGGWLAE